MERSGKWPVWEWRQDRNDESILCSIHFITVQNATKNLGPKNAVKVGDFFDELQSDVAKKDHVS